MSYDSVILSLSNDPVKFSFFDLILFILIFIFTCFRTLILAIARNSILPHALQRFLEPFLASALFLATVPFHPFHELALLVSDSRSVVGPDSKKVSKYERQDIRDKDKKRFQTNMNQI